MLPVQVPSDPVHRESLHGAAAEEDGSVPDGGAEGQGGSVPHQHERMQEAPLPGDPEGEGSSQGVTQNQ